MSSYLVITEPARWSDSTGRTVRQVQIADIRDTVVHEHTQVSKPPGRTWSRGSKTCGRSSAGRKLLEAIMADFVAVAALAAFVLGAIMTVLVVAAWAIRREDRKLTLTSKAPNRLLSGVRRVMGVGQRDVDAELAELITGQLTRR